MDYDVIIVGGGPAGLFSAYYLSEHSDKRVLLIEKGKVSQKRNCPIKSYQECIKCKPCNILSGIGGAGLFSDGKLNYIYKLGKTDLSQFMPLHEAEKLIDETEQIFNKFGMDGPSYPTDMEEARANTQTSQALRHRPAHYKAETFGQRSPSRTHCLYGRSHQIQRGGHAHLGRG